MNKVGGLKEHCCCGCKLNQHPGSLGLCLKLSVSVITGIWFLFLFLILKLFKCKDSGSNFEFVDLSSHDGQNGSGSF